MDEQITIEWIEDDYAYIVRQGGEFIGDFMLLLPACSWALAVSGNTGGDVVVLSVKES